MEWSAILKVTGLTVIVIGMLSFSYLFYEKNVMLSVILFIVSIVLGIYIVTEEIGFKKKRHDAPWLFDNYKGE